MMKDLSSRRRRARLLAGVLGLGCAPALLAQPLPFVGQWLRDAPPRPQVVYPVLTIDASSIAWIGANKTPTCVQRFLLENEKPGTVYADGRGARFVAGAKGSLPTYLLQISASTCSGVEDEVRISFPVVYDRDRIEFIEYVKGRPVSALRFHRSK